MFTLAYWSSEVVVFQESFANPATSDDVLELMVRGICFVAAHTAKHNPEKTTEILMQFKNCMTIAETRMGPGWFVQNAVIIATHSDPD